MEKKKEKEKKSNWLSNFIVGAAVGVAGAFAIKKIFFDDDKNKLNK